MTATHEPAPLPDLARRARNGRWRTRLQMPPQVFQHAILIVLLGILALDRYQLCREFLFKYTDEDQTIMWLAAHELLQGRIHEPCFYGQDYNSCIEGYLAAPLIAAGLPYHVGVPLVTLVLGLLPFLVLAAVAWRRNHPLVAATALLVPLLLPLRYAMMTGMPRGFITGIAFAALPMLLLLPPSSPTARRRLLSRPSEPVQDARRRPFPFPRAWPSLRYFSAAAVAVFAIQLNPNCLVLLVPVAIYAILTSWRIWQFWVFGTAGMLAAAPYLLYVHQFYHRFHTDYPVYLRGRVFTWSFGNFYDFLWSAVAPIGQRSEVLFDLVPQRIAPAHAPAFMLTAFGAVLLLLLARLRIAAVLSALGGIAFLFITFAYDRVNDARGGNAVSFPTARMYLAIPVLLVWLLFLVNHAPGPYRFSGHLARWATRGALAGMLVTALLAVRSRSAELPAIADREVRTSTVCILVPVDLLYATAADVQRAADTHDASLVAVGAMTQKFFAYSLPCLTTCDTLLPPMERRTWRIVEENSPNRHDNILLIGLPGGTPVAGGEPLQTDGQRPLPAVDAASARGAAPPPPGGQAGRGRGGRGGRGQADASLAAGRGPRRPRNFDTTPILSLVPIGRAADGTPFSANDTLRALGINIPRIYTPAPTPDNPTPQPLVARPSWGR